MSKIECEHVKYCENCDRYYCSDCVCACKRAEFEVALKERGASTLGKPEVEDWQVMSIMPNTKGPQEKPFAISVNGVTMTIYGRIDNVEVKREKR